MSVLSGTLTAMARPEVPSELLDRVDAILGALPDCRPEDAWVGVRWRVGQATVAHIFGGEDQLFRIVFHADDDEVAAFEHLGDRYFRAGWGANVVGVIVDEASDWEEVTELLTDSYCIQAPPRLAAQVQRPEVDRDLQPLGHRSPQPDPP